MRRGTTLVLLLGLTGCDQLGVGKIGEVLGVEAPEASLNRVELLKSPSTTDLVGYGCVELLGESACALAGLESPPKRDLQFSFDVVFDLTNPNEDLPIPLVETLLGFTAFDTANLGALCVSFCDPDDEACVPGANVAGACDTEGAQDVQGPEDLVPTVDELLGLAEAAASGAFDNGDWRVIAGGETLESHLQFDIGIDPMLQIGDELLAQAVDDALAGRRVELDVPYTVEGTLFFDVPELGRHMIGFGPFDDTWQLQQR